jgi:hypothetical protein
MSRVKRDILFHISRPLAHLNIKKLALFDFRFQVAVLISKRVNGSMAPWLHGLITTSLTGRTVSHHSYWEEAP